ncbi:transcription factor SRM1-like [Rhodamnia argentea]|uniref:Transcription factor SRM1-like n=1 Tax=Rhodamnia argentea TaxID=178133 RepID=A0A8B8QII2_9MYRT|nr:transcription factor SRM1-like [Rhodamnia argentea]XP_030547016.1 transcription factor SRM1-like [Rhodamnia argentea]
MTVDETMTDCSWSREQDKAFENGLVTYLENLADRWEKIAADVPGKTVEEIKRHYEILVDDVNRIESGCVELPPYSCSSEGSTSHGSDETSSKKGGHVGNLNGEPNHGGKASRSDQERRKGIAWTEEEHRLFLLGLDKYGKGDWRSISRNFVVTRTPTQVASHAQKYFIRLNSMNKDRRRSSIHDITSVDNGELSTPLGPITGQTNSPAAGVSSSKPSKQPTQPPTGPASVSMYSAPAIGQPIGGPLVSAVGTLVNLPGSSHMSYGVRAAVPGAMVPGAPMSVGHITYPMPRASAQR